jgi:hypothetical protein
MNRRRDGVSLVSVLSVSIITPPVFGGTVVLKAGTASDPAHHYNRGIFKFGEIVPEIKAGRW